MEWIDIKEKLPNQGIVMAKTCSDEVRKCYFHSDGFIWLAFYTNEKLSKFQDHETRKFLHDVTHWKPLNKAKEYYALEDIKQS